ADVFAALRDDVLALQKYLSHVRSIEVLSRTERGDLVDTEVSWRAGANVPAFVRRLVGKEAFEWIDYATWDASTHSVDWHVDCGALRCAARDVFVSTGANVTEI